MIPPWKAAHKKSRRTKRAAALLMNNANSPSGYSTGSSTNLLMVRILPGAWTLLTQMPAREL